MIRPSAKEIATKLNRKVGRDGEVMFAYRSIGALKLGTGWWNGIAFSYAEKDGWFMILEVVKTLYPNHLIMGGLKLNLNGRIAELVSLHRIENDPKRVRTIFMQEYLRSKRYQKSLFPRISSAGTIYEVIDAIANSCRAAPHDHRMKLALVSYRIMEEFKLSDAGWT